MKLLSRFQRWTLRIVLQAHKAIQSSSPPWAGMNHGHSFLVPKIDLLVNIEIWQRDWRGLTLRGGNMTRTWDGLLLWCLLLNSTLLRTLSYCDAPLSCDGESILRYDQSRGLSLKGANFNPPNTNPANNAQCHEQAIKLFKTNLSPHQTSKSRRPSPHFFPFPTDFPRPSKPRISFPLLSSRQIRRKIIILEAEGPKNKYDLIQRLCSSCPFWVKASTLNQKNPPMQN